MNHNKLYKARNQYNIKVETAWKEFQIKMQAILQPTLKEYEKKQKIAWEEFDKEIEEVFKDD